MESRTRFKDGTPVRSIGYEFATGVPHGATGVVDNPKESFLRSKGFTYVAWDNGSWSGVFSGELEVIREGAAR